MTGPRLEIRNVSKRFDAMEALRGVGFSVAPGEIHALFGENGAGKSTLVKIITGLLAPDQGSILLDGTSRTFQTSMEARAAGITAVYQDPKLFPHLDVAENIFMGIYPRTPAGTVDRRTMYKLSAELLSTLGVALSPRSLIAGVSVAELQFVEIARAISTDVRLLILDEPTSALTPAEAEKLFGIMRKLKAQGTSIIFISHRLDEVMSVSDAITILRDGQWIATRPRTGFDEQEVVSLTVGREVKSFFASGQHARKLGDTRLKVEGLYLEGIFTPVSFSLKGGEIVGMFGLVGAGRSEIAQALFGITRPSSGKVTLNGRAVEVRNPQQMVRLGLAYLPEDRDKHGLITDFTIVRNISLPVIGDLSRGGVTQYARERRVADRYASEFQIKAASVDQLVTALSGGNRQKVVFAKWLTTNPSVLILDEPTHGIDVGAKMQVHEKINQLAEAGIAVLMISSDLPEIMAMSDRVIVIADGRLVKEFSREEATREKIMLAASSTHPQEHVE